MIKSFWAVVYRHRLYWRVVDFSLFMMVIGPLIAPYFAQIPNPLFQGVATFIFNIGGFICPQPQIAFLYGGRLYAICYRCLAALLGLIIARWLHRPNGAMANMVTWSLPRRFVLLLICVTWLEIDLFMINHGVWSANIPLMILHGIPYEISVGATLFAPLVALDRQATLRSPALSASLS